MLPVSCRAPHSTDRCVVRALHNPGFAMIRKKPLMILVVAGSTILLSLGARIYLSGAHRVAAEWLGCHGRENRSLVTASDRRYWDEAHPDSAADPLRALRDACVDTATVKEVARHGRSADVKYVLRQPDLSWDQATEFPATSTPDERIAIVRERASRATYRETLGTLNLRFEGLAWRVSLGLEEAVFFMREIAQADSLEKAGNDAGAIAVYDRLASRPGLDSAKVKLLKEGRLNVLARKACRMAVKQFLKYPEAAEFHLTGLADLAKNGPISVIGSALAPNAFGVKGKLTINCDVTFSSDSPTAYVKLLILPDGDPTSLVDEDRVVVHL